MIRAALSRALELHGAAAAGDEAGSSFREVTASDLTELGLNGADGSSKLRASVCRALGIGYCNSKAMLSRLRGFRIGYEELKQAVYEEKKTR